MDLDMELGIAQEDIYFTEKEIVRVKEELARLEAKLMTLQQEEAKLIQKKTEPVAGRGGILITAVWGDGDYAVEEEGNGPGEDSDHVQCSTQELGHDQPVCFSQTLSDVPDTRVKVTRKEAFNLKKANKNSIREAAEALVKKVLGIQEVDLSSDDLKEFEEAVKKVGLRLWHLQKETEKKRKGLQRPDDTFLSSSAFEELKTKVHAEENISEQSEGEPEEEAAAAGRGFYKPFKDLVHHSKDMKRRAAPMLVSVRDWCEANFCDIVSAIGYMLHAVCYNSDKMVAVLGWRLFIQGKGAVMTSEVPHLVALWLVERLRLGRGRYTDTRLQMLR
jgi:hypothetical protein